MSSCIHMPACLYYISLPRIACFNLAHLHKMSGSYGLKSDIKDISNLLEDISLDDLLNGNSKYLKLRQDKEKQVPDTKETFEHLVRRAFSVLPAGKHLRHPRLSDMDSKKTPSSSVSPPIAASFGITDQADISEVTMSSCNKVCDE